MEYPSPHPLLSPISDYSSSYCPGFPGLAAVIMNLGDLWTNSALLTGGLRTTDRHPELGKHLRHSTPEKADAG
jgi:hypothetical protein